MRLLIDAGNTRVKWQVRKPGQVIAKGQGNIDEPALYQGAVPYRERIAEVIVCTVRSESDRQTLEGGIKTLVSVPVTYAWTRPRFQDLVCAYQEPDKMGADRWMALVAARRRCKEELVVVDAGSAVTIDWIMADGTHQGGYILPGRRLLLESLRQNTARVLFDPSHPGTGKGPGRSTAECVQQGNHWLFEAVARQVAAEAQARGARIYVTGGDANLLMPYLPVSAEYAEDLVFEGLECVA